MYSQWNKKWSIESEYKPHSWLKGLIDSHPITFSTKKVDFFPDKSERSKVSSTLGPPGVMIYVGANVTNMCTTDEIMPVDWAIHSRQG